MALFDRLDENTLAGLSASEYRDAVVCAEYIRTTIDRWQYPPTPGRGAHSVAAFQPIGNRHPVHALRDVMRNAPLEPIARVQPRIAFLQDQSLEESIATDVASAEAALADGRYKNACVMAGAAVEAVLLWAVQRRTAAHWQAALAKVQGRRSKEGKNPLSTPDPDPRRWGLEQYIEIARELPVLSGSAANAAMLAKDFRNLIHPGRAERAQQRATRGSAIQALAAAALSIEDLAERASKGEL